MYLWTFGKLCISTIVHGINRCKSRNTFVSILSSTSHALHLHLLLVSFWALHSTKTLKLLDRRKQSSSSLLNQRLTNFLQKVLLNLLLLWAWLSRVLKWLSIPFKTSRKRNPLVIPLHQRFIYLNMYATQCKMLLLGNKSLFLQKFPSWTLFVAQRLLESATATLVFGTKKVSSFPMYFFTLIEKLDENAITYISSWCDHV